MGVANARVPRERHGLCAAAYAELGKDARNLITHCLLALGQRSGNRAVIQAACNQ